MTRTLGLRTATALLLVVAALLCASCGSSGGPTTAGESIAAPAHPRSARISAGAPTAGVVLVSEKGQTIYTFEKDSKGGSPTCYGRCAEEWPPILTTDPPRPMRWEIKPALLGTVQRKDGSQQVTYAGYPLYEYAHDRMTEARGFPKKEFGGSWYLLTPDGVVLTHREDGS